MEVDSRCRCVICSIPSAESVEMVRETFSSSRTLEKTLEMLWGRLADSKVNTKRMVKEITAERRNLFCLPCLAVLHAGMRLVSEIMQLEERLFNLIEKITTEGAMIFYKEENKSQDQQTNINCITATDHTDDIPSRNISQQPCPARQRRDMIPKRPKRGVIRNDQETSDTEDEKPQKRVYELRKRIIKRRHDSNSSQDEAEGGNPTNPPRSIRKKIMKKKSVSPEPMKSKSTPKRKCTKISGVQECPSCDYRVDIRTPKQAAQSPESFPKSVREKLRVNSGRQLAEHFRNAHLSASVIESFKLKKSEDRNSFKCTECPLKATSFREVILHYISIHVRQRQRPGPKITDRSRLSCPEEGCSFVAVLLNPGDTWTKNSDANMRNTLSTHVIKYHDWVSSSAEKYGIPSSRSLVVESADKNKEFRCTRCEFKIHLDMPPSLFSNSRRAFLKHFFDVHLRNNLISDI